ncbi:MAG: aminotransferase class IV, partial [Actinomycetota bacterium]
MKTDPPPINDPAQAPEQAGASPTAPFVCLNGEMLCAAKARISVLDHGLLYGDGLFETLRIVQGRCFQMEAHLQRLSEGAERLRISLPWPREELRRALQETVAANGLSTGAIRLTVTRGAGAPVPSPVVCAEPTFFITLRGGSAPPDVPGVGRLSAGPEHPRLVVPGIKSSSYLPPHVA